MPNGACFTRAHNPALPLAYPASCSGYSPSLASVVLKRGVRTEEIGARDPSHGAMSEIQASFLHPLFHLSLRCKGTRFLGSFFRCLLGPVSRHPPLANPFSEPLIAPALLLMYTPYSPPPLLASQAHAHNRKHTLVHFGVDVYQSHASNQLDCELDVLLLKLSEPDGRPNDH